MAVTLQSLPEDIITDIFSLCLITDKRSFIRTCRSYNNYSKLMADIEKNFQSMILKTNFFYKRNFTGFSNPLYKYTIELVYDNYLVPDKYIILENRILHQYKRIYYRVGLRGNLNLIQKFLRLNKNNYLNDNADYVMRGASKNGHKEILKWMKRNKYEFNRWTSAFAVKGNQFILLKWLIKHGCPIDSLCTTYCAKIGNFEMLKWLVNKKKCGVNDYTVDLASRKGHFDIVKFLHKKHPEYGYNICCGASRGGHINLLEWALHKNFNFSGSCEEASYGGHIHVLEWFKNNDLFENTQLACESAVQGGHFECLKWLVKNGAHLSNDICNCAVKQRNFEILQWLVLNGCKLNKRICHDAAEYNQLEILKWLVERGCKMFSDTATAAAFNGHLELLQWAVDNGCRMKASVISYAAGNGHLDLIKWAVDNGCEWNAEACESTVLHDHLDILKWLRTNGCPWDETVCVSAVEYKNIDILRWAIENGCKWGNKTYQLAYNGKDVYGIVRIKNPDKKILEYLDTKLK